MKLPKNVRDTIRRGGTVPAIVESVAQGYATVRLGKSGARLTNLPILNDIVRAGDKVVVDYSAEGRPTIRPLTVIPTVGAEEELELAERVVRPEPEEELPEDPIPENLFTPVVGRVTNTNPPSTTTSWFAFPFPDVLWDTDNLWDGEYLNFKQAGTYMIKCTMGFEPFGYAIANATVSLMFDNNGWGEMYDDGWMTRRMEGQLNPMVITVGGLWKVPLNLVPYGGDDQLRVWVYMSHLPGDYSGDLVTAYKAGEYPILEWWMVAPMITTGGRASPFHYWYI